MHLCCTVLFCEQSPFRGEMYIVRSDLTPVMGPKPRRREGRAKPPKREPKSSNHIHESFGNPCGSGAFLFPAVGKFPRSGGPPLGSVVLFPPSCGPFFPQWRGPFPPNFRRAGCVKQRMNSNPVKVGGCGAEGGRAGTKRKAHTQKHPSLPTLLPNPLPSSSTQTLIYGLGFRVWGLRFGVWLGLRLRFSGRFNLGVLGLLIVNACARRLGSRADRR